MVKKEFTFKGKTVEELKKMSLSELAQLFTARRRRSIKRGFTEQQKILLKKIRVNEKNIETHCRDTIILPEMIGITIKVHRGKEFIPVMIETDMIGHCLGAAGSIEAVASVLQLHKGFIHASINCEDLHENIQPFADSVVHRTIQRDINIVAKSSFGFGDVNGCLIFKKWI